MSDKPINRRIPAYKKALASGEVQETYQSLVSIIQRLRTDFAKDYTGAFSVANVLHGYIDYTYFYLQNDYLKHRKLKFAIVLNHQKATFELWLLGRTKEVQRVYWQKLKGVEWVNEDVMPEYSIFERDLVTHPDFDNYPGLSASIRNTFRSLSSEIFSTLEAYE